MSIAPPPKINGTNLKKNHIANSEKSVPWLKKYKKLNEALVGIIEDYSLVTFQPLSVEVILLILWSQIEAAGASAGIFFIEEECK